MESRHHERHGLVWPVLLIGAGIVLLLSNLGWLPWGVWQTLLSLWPVLLIVAGLDLLFGRRSAVGALLAAVVALAVLAGALYLGLTRAQTASDAYRTEVVSQALNGARAGTVEIEFGAGDLRVDALAEATGSLLEGRLQLHAGETVSSKTRQTGDALTYTLESHGQWTAPMINSWPAGKTWQISLSRDVPIRLRIDGGAGRTDLTLEELTIPDVTVKGGVGQVALTLPRRGRGKVTIDGGVGGVEVIVPSGVAVSARVDGGLGGVTTRGAFQKSGNTYTSPGYALAENRVEVFIKGGVGQVILREGSAKE